MRLFYHDDSEPVSEEKVKEVLRAGYGIPHPEKVMGFAHFLSRLPDIYLYGRLEKIAENDESIDEQLNGFIKRFVDDDYGFVTGSELSNNGDNNWLCGSYIGSIGRYSMEEYGGVVLQIFQDCGYMYMIDDDIEELYSKYGTEVGGEINYISW